MTARPWREVLVIGEGVVSAKTIEGAFRHLSNHRRPDAIGGSDAKMSELQQARDEALKEIG